MATMTRRQFAVPPAPTFVAKGFTLIELAIVLFVVALLLGGMLLPLAAQQDIRNYGDTQKILAESRDALLGFAMANDRLPCPASSTSNGVESFCLNPSDNCATVTTTVQTHGRCSHPYTGFLPAATLGFTPIDAQGYALDGWGGETLRRIRYAVSTNSPSSNDNYPPYHTDFDPSKPAEPFAFTYASGMKTISMTALSPDLRVCNTGTGMQNTGLRLAACAASASLATDAVAVVYSLGKNAATGGTSTDENHNPNPQSTLATDRAFVNAAQGTAFDDQLLWLSKSALFNRMVAAGRLP